MNITEEGMLTVQTKFMSVEASVADVVPMTTSKADRAAAAASSRAGQKKSNGRQSSKGMPHAIGCPWCPGHV